MPTRWAAPFVLLKVQYGIKMESINASPFEIQVT